MAIELLKHQLEFIQSNYRHTGLVGGFRSGKSQAGVYKTLSKKLSLPKIDVAYYLPTYGLIKDIAYPKFREVLEKQSIPYTLNKSDHDITTPFGRIIMRSMDNPELIIGYEVGYSLIDEADVLSTDRMQEVMIKVLARNSAKYPNNNNATDFVSTPEGFKFLYEYYVKNGNDRRKLIQANTLDNTTLPQSYIDNLYDTYPKEQLEAYMKGNFVNLTTGTVYRNFDRKKNIDNSKEVKPNDVLYVGMDFNITKMACTISIKEGNNRYVVDEIVDEYDTSDIAKEIINRYPNNRIFVYPDSAGAARNTSGKSDHDILRKVGFKLIAPSKNPSIRDRINSVNKEFADLTTFINSNRCPSLVSALEKQAYNKNGEPDKTTGHDHILDGFGYEVYNSKYNTIKTRSVNAF